MRLFLAGAIPELMTYHGRNYDIIFGITGLILGIYLYIGKVNRKLLLTWNMLGICFVLFIMVNGILSARTPFQAFGIDQPNIAVEYFPFILLPSVLVPLVVLTHILDLKKLWQSKKESVQ